MRKLTAMIGVGGCSFVLGCLVGFSAGGCQTRESKPPLERYLLHAQTASWQGSGVLTTIVAFKDLADLRDFSLRSYEVVAAGGGSFAMSSLSVGAPKGGGRSIVFDVDSSRIPESVGRVDCSFHIEIGNEQYVLTSAFVRDPSGPMKWNALKDTLKLKAEPLAARGQPSGNASPRAEAKQPPLPGDNNSTAKSDSKGPWCGTNSVMAAQRVEAQKGVLRAEVKMALLACKTFDDSGATESEKADAKKIVMNVLRDLDRLRGEQEGDAAESGRN